MWKLIDSLRQQPKPIRQTAAFWGALLFTLLLVGIWSLSLPSRLASVMNLTDEQDVRPPSQLFSSLSEVSTSLRAAVMGSAEPAASPQRSTSAPAYEIDLTTLGNAADEATTTGTTTATSSSAGQRVWTREYTEQPGGVPILISTTSKATTSPTER